MTGMSETDSCRLCEEEEESSEHLWLRCSAFIAERQRLGLGRTFDELVRIASAAEIHLQAPAVTPTTTIGHHRKVAVIVHEMVEGCIPWCTIYTHDAAIRHSQRYVEDKCQWS